MIARKKKATPRVKTPQDWNFNRLFPNIITVLALCTGLTAVKFAIQSHWEKALIAVLIAGVLDMLDGRMARLLSGQTKFGAELDSLADAVNFGVAPAFIIYLWCLHDYGRLGWVAVVVFVVCQTLRLARFNTMVDTDLPDWGYKFFVGMPAPAAAACALLPMSLYLATDLPWVAHPVLISVWTLACAFMMISRIPTISFKAVHIAPKYLRLFLLFFAFLGASLVIAPWWTLSICVLIYIGTFPLVIRRYFYYKRQHAG